MITRPVAAFAAVIGLSLAPLALAGPTAWLLIPVHAVFSGTVVAGATVDGVAGRAERARAWGFGYLLATLAMVAALQVGSAVRGGSAWYWGGPWLAAALWAWIPPVVAGLAGWAGDLRGARRTRRVVRARRTR